MSEIETKVVSPQTPAPKAEVRAEATVVESESDALLDSYKKEQFAHAVAFGVPIPQAMRQAGYTNTTAGLGYLLLKDQAVVDVIDADRSWMREKMKASQEQIVAQLDNDRAFAYACENAGAAVAATMAKAKVVGIADPHAAAGRGAPKRVIIEWDEEGSSEVPLLESGVG